MSEFPVSITVQDLASWRQDGRALTLVDVREPWELALCKFDDALSIPLQELPARVGEVPRDRPVVVLCHLGGRSQRAVAWLRQAGVANAINLDGGIDAWAREVDSTVGVY